MRKYVIWVVLAALAAGGYWALDVSGRPQVRLAAPNTGPAVRAVYATGVVEPETWAAVAPLEGGRIVSIIAFENADVVMGEPLAQLDDQEAEAVIEELEARKTFLESEVKRTGELLARSVISQKGYDQAISELREVTAAIAGAKVRRDHLTLRAPMSGVVLRQDGEVGEVIERGEAVFWVGVPRPLRIEADVDEEDIPLVETGQVVQIKADAFPDRALTGRVSEITPKGDPINKSFRVRIALPDDTPLMIGMTTETNIVVEEHDGAMLVPSSAIRGDAVWAVVDGHARPLPVEIGIAGHMMTEIVGGIDGGQRFIVELPDGLADGDKVRVTGGAD